MTSSSAIDRDTQYFAERVKGAEPDENGKGWTLSLEEGGCIWLTSEHCQVQPQPGETARLYGKGFGYDVRGIAIGGRVYRYKSEEVAQADHVEWVTQQERERQAQLEASLPERDARRAKLPEIFQARVLGFIEARPHWRRDHEGYELFVCEEAAAISAHFAGNPEGLAAFRGLPYEEQKATVPGLRYDQHSGNTFGAACALARCRLSQPELVPQMHGALCPLVGCQDYGCFAARTAAPT